MFKRLVGSVCKNSLTKLCKLNSFKFQKWEKGERQKLFSSSQQSSKTLHKMKRPRPKWLTVRNSFSMSLKDLFTFLILTYPFLIHRVENNEQCKGRIVLG